MKPFLPSLFRIVLFGAVLAYMFSLHPALANASTTKPVGSCGDAVNDDAHLFANNFSDVVGEVQKVNKDLGADTRVVTVTTALLAGSSLKSYANYIEGKCPTWQTTHLILFIISPGLEPFLRLGSDFSGKLTPAAFQQILSSKVQPEFQTHNYSGGTIAGLDELRKQLVPNYTWIWITAGVLVLLIIAGLGAFFIMQRRQVHTGATQAQTDEINFKKQAVNSVDHLKGKIENLSPRVQILLALVPRSTATQLSGLLETANGETSRLQESLGNLLGNSSTNPDDKTLLTKAQYEPIIYAYRGIYTEAQEPEHLLSALEMAVQDLEQNPQAEIDFQRLTARNGQWDIARNAPNYPQR